MPLEDLVGPNKFIDDFVREWPLGIDPFAEGDDHIRGVKNVLQNSFPTVAEARYPVSFEPGPAGNGEEKQGANELAVGTTLQRPSAPSTGAMRLNSETGYIEQWNGLAWVNKFAVTDRSNTYDGQSDAVQEPAELYRANVVPVVNQYYSNLAFEAGAGPGGTEQGALRWYTSPDAVTRHRMAVRTANNEAGTKLMVGDGVMVPTADNPADIEDPGRGYLNAKNGLLIDGKPIVEVSESGLFAWDWSQQIRWAHGLSGRPHFVHGHFVCQTAQFEYVPGDEFFYGTQCATIGGNSSWTYMSQLILENDTECLFQVGPNVMVAPKVTGGAGSTVTPSYWQFYFRAFRINGV